MKVTKDNIHTVLPHGAHFIMVDSLTDASPNVFDSEFTVRKDNIFLQEDVLQVSSLIENVAQTCAAGFGYLQQQCGGKPPTGFIGSVSNLVVHQLPTVDSLIKTHVAVTYQLGSIYSVRGTHTCDDVQLMECDMKIVIS